MKRITMIAAVAANGIIGKRNGLPWDKIPEDMEHFRKLTMGKSVIMGRRTFESLGKPLDGRVNIVLTRQFCFPDHDNVYYAQTKTEAYHIAEYHSSGDEIMVIGGAKVFQLFLPEATRLYITHVHAELPGDSFFPFIAPCEWTTGLRMKVGTSPKGSKHPLTFATYNRKAW